MSVLERVRDRTPVHEHDGRSGAAIETGRLDDGTLVWIKTSALAGDIGTVLTGSATRELALFEAGVFDRLPAGVAAAVVAADVVDGTLVTVTRDAGPGVLRWDRTLSAAEVHRVFTAVARLHRRFLGDPPAGLCPLETRLALLGPQRVDAIAAVNPSLAGALARGWELFADLVPADVADAVARCQSDPAPLAAAMSTGGTTLLHGDFWFVNIALDVVGGGITLLDWGLATLGPAPVDFVTFCVGGTSNVALSRDDLLAEARLAGAGLAGDDTWALAELWALIELGWNKALDAVDHPDPAKRAAEAADLGFWVDRARRTLDQGLLP